MIRDSTSSQWVVVVKQDIRFVRLEFMEAQACKYEMEQALVNGFSLVILEGDFLSLTLKLKK